MAIQRLFDSYLTDLGARLARSCPAVTPPNGSLIPKCIKMWRWTQIPCVQGSIYDGEGSMSRIFCARKQKIHKKNLRASYTTNIWSGNDSLEVVVVLYGSFHVEQTQHCIKRRIYIPLQILARQMFYYVPCGFVKSFWHPLGSLG